MTDDLHYRVLKRKEAEYEALRAEIDQLRTEFAQQQREAVQHARTETVPNSA